MRVVEEDGKVPNLEKHAGLKVAISLSVLVGCWILWFVLDRGWIMVLGLSIVGCLCGEYVGSKIFANNPWFDRLSVEHSGFSVWRIVLGLVAVLLVFSVFLLARVVVSNIFH